MPAVMSACAFVESAEFAAAAAAAHAAALAMDELSTVGSNSPSESCNASEFDVDESDDNTGSSCSIQAALVDVEQWHSAEMHEMRRTYLLEQRAQLLADEVAVAAAGVYMTKSRRWQQMSSRRK